MYKNCNETCIKTVMITFGQIMNGYLPQYVKSLKKVLKI